MNTEHLRYLLAIADCHSISKASEQLQLKQQYLSNLVRSMEEYFGTTIFNRHSRGVTLTEDGAYLMIQARQIVMLANTMEQDYLYPSNMQKRGESGELTVCTPPLQSHRYFFTLFKTFRKEFPNIRLVLREQHIEKNLETLAETEEAIVFFVSKEAPETIQASLPVGMKAIFIRHCQMVAVTSQDNIAARGRKEIACKELVNLPLVIYSFWGQENSVVYRLLGEYGELNVHYVVDNSDFLQEILSSGNYYSIMERQSAMGTELLQIPLKEDISVSVYVVVQEKALQQSLAVRSMVNMLLLQHQNLLLSKEE